MITFYRTDRCDGCKAIETTLKEMRLAHEVEVVSGPEELPDVAPDDARPPVLVDQDEVFVGRDDILGHLEQMQDFKDQWYKFGSDACYCDEQGNIE